LKNKEVLGERKGGMPEMVFEYVLAQKGIDKKDVNINQSIDFGSTAAAFSGAVGGHEADADGHDPKPPEEHKNDQNDLRCGAQ